MKRTDLRKILIIGSGPIVIGQGCEFDYSGVQAVKALKSLGYEVVLVNSNPATVMTDPDRADRTYIEPLTADVLHEVIRRERPDALLPTLGGQTALNLAMELAKSGVLKRYRVELIGADADAIERAEDRNLFKEAMRGIGLDMPRSGSAHSLAEAEAVARTIGSWPLIVRPGFTLGGTGGGIAHSPEEFAKIVSGGLEASLNHEVLVEESLIGWKEYEMEVMRDKAGNAVIVCSIENMDPMGVHTGDSITVAPILTLTDREYQEMRDDSIKVLEKIGIETGGSNVQWAVNPKDGRRIIIEMNPRVSRSSALASKATGFPIAKIAALLAVGFTLDEIKNDITGKTLACFEPSLDYVVVKIPRFAFEKFPGANATLGTQMKSVGEVMAIGRTFKQAYLKAVRSLEAPLKYHDAESYDPWFKRELDEIEAFKEHLGSFAPPARGARAGEVTLPPDLLRQAKVLGFGDKDIAEAIGEDEITVRTKRIALGIRPEFGEVDTCAGEFEAVTPYYYSYYGWDDVRCGTQDAKEPSLYSSAPRRKIMVLGGGPNRIGQGIEFDWCCCHAAFALRGRGYEVVMVNSNPETVSTDYDTSDRLYFEPLTFEDVMEIYDREKCDGVIVQYGGQTPLNLAERLEKAGARIIGTSPHDIALAEDRDFFRALVAEVGMKQPASGIAHSVDDALRIAKEIGYPVLVRPSFVLGGRGMAIAYDKDELQGYVAEAIEVSSAGAAAAEGGERQTQIKPILIDKFLEHAIELDVDAVSDGETTVIGAILEHVEAAGCHSGDAAAITPPISLSEQTLAEVRHYAEVFAKRLHVVGLMNLQLAVKDGEVWMIEVNPRASRTVPFVSKATGIPLADIGALVMTGEKLDEILGRGTAGARSDALSLPSKPRYYCVKEAVFPYVKFPGAKITLSPEMKSTGEVMAIDYDRFSAYYKSQIACGSPLPKSGNVFLSVRDEDKPKVAELAAALANLGFGIYATLGTSTYLWNRGIESRAAFRISKGRPSAIDLIRMGKINWVVNTSESDGEASGDSVKLRSCAVAAGIPVTTTLAGFAAAVAGLTETQAECAVYSLQEYHLAH